jgi:hypothetical protein
VSLGFGIGARVMPDSLQHLIEGATAAIAAILALTQLLVPSLAVVIKRRTTPKQKLQISFCPHFS